MSIFLTTNDVVYGNDIVDLKDPDASIEHLNSRFIKKICTQNEIHWFFQNENYNKEDLLTLWKIWAIKESSYKAISRIFYIPFFKYKEYIVQQDFLSTKYKNFLLNNIIYFNLEFVLALSYFYGKINIDKNIKENILFLSWIKKIITNDDSYLKEQNSYSIKIRKYINDTLYDIFQEKTMIYRKFEPEHNIYMPPYLYFKRSFYPISLSHHGRFLLFTLSVREDSFDIITKNHTFSIIKISPMHYLIYEEK